MTVIITDRKLEELDFIRCSQETDWMVCGPFRLEPIDISDEEIGLLEDIFEHGPMFAYYTREYGTVAQLAFAIIYLRCGRIIAFADRSHVRRFSDSYPVSRVDISKQPSDRGAMSVCRIRKDIIYVFTDSEGVAGNRDSDVLSLMGEPYEFSGEIPWSPYTANDGTTLSELAERVGGLANVVLTYRYSEVEAFVEKATETDLPLHGAVDPIDVCVTGHELGFPDAVVRKFGIVPLFNMHGTRWTRFISNEIPELKPIRTGSSEDYKRDTILLIAIIQDPE